MEPAIQLQNVSKIYDDFTLRCPTFSLARGRVLGLIGENGAGKTTLIHLLLHEIEPDTGEITLLGKPLRKEEARIKDQVGVVFDNCHQIEIFTVKEIAHMLSLIYTKWDTALFFAYMEQFHLPLKKKIKDFSKGMKMKLNFACALSHHPSLLILDEATSGLDPIMRNEILDLLLEFMMDETHTILMSSHITTDLEKIADDIAFLHNGSLLFYKSKEELLDQYGILHCKAAFFEQLNEEDVLAYQKEEMAYHVLIKDRASFLRIFPEACMDIPTIDEIMLFYVKGGSRL